MRASGGSAAAAPPPQHAPATRSAGSTSGTATGRSWSASVRWFSPECIQGCSVHCGRGRGGGVCVCGGGGFSCPPSQACGTPRCARPPWEPAPARVGPLPARMVGGRQPRPQIWTTMPCAGAFSGAPTWPRGRGAACTAKCTGRRGASCALAPPPRTRRRGRTQPLHLGAGGAPAPGGTGLRRPLRGHQEGQARTQLPPRLPLRVAVHTAPRPRGQAGSKQPAPVCRGQMPREAAPRAAGGPRPPPPPPNPLSTPGKLVRADQVLPLGRAGAARWAQPHVCSRGASCAPWRRRPGLAAAGAERLRPLRRHQEGQARAHMKHPDYIHIWLCTRRRGPRGQAGWSI